ncbi:MAG: hypothetical protein ACLQKA_02845, partial [Bryobacteraceae bacterium]
MICPICETKQCGRPAAALALGLAFALVLFRTKAVVGAVELIPLALRGVKFRPLGAVQILRIN